jgi:hypothetical protein
MANRGISRQTTSTHSTLGEVLGAIFGISVSGVAAVVLGYLLFTGFVLPTVQYAGALLLAVWEAPSLFGEVLWLNLAVDVLFGAATGLVIGWLRRRLQVRNDVLENMIDATVGRDSVTAAQLGWMFVAGSAVLGALCGVVIGALGLFEPPQLLTGGWQDLAGSPAVALLTSIGWFGGGGDPPLLASGFLAVLVAILVVVVCLCMAVSCVTAVLGSAFGEVLAAGAAKGAAKALGTSLLLLATRQWDGSARRSPGTEEEESFRKGWLLRCLRTGAIEGALIASLLILLALGSARIAENSVVSEIRATLPAGEPRIFGEASLDARTRFVGFTGGGRYLVANMSNYSRRLLMWDLRDGSEIRFPEEVDVAALDPDGRHLATSALGGTMSLWDAASRTVTPLMDAQHNADAAFSDDGRLMAVHDSGDNISIWDVAGNRRRDSLQLALEQDEEISQLAFHPADPSRIVAIISNTASIKSRIQLWNLTTKRLERSKDVIKSSLDQAVRHPTRPLLAVPGSHGVAYVSFGGDQSYKPVRLDDERADLSVSFRSDGKVLAMARDLSVLLWYVDGGRKLSTLPIAGCPKGRKACPEGDWTTAVAFSQDGRLLAAGMDSGLIYVWKVEDR